MKRFDEHSFEVVLCVSFEDIEFNLSGHQPLQWAEFILNPRRLRGSDFLMRWSQGVWSEERITQAINETPNYFALPYGPSGTAPDDDPRAFELYFERLDAANPDSLKRPDLLIFRKEDEQVIKGIVEQLGGNQELPFHREIEAEMKEILAKAVLAVECENSLCRARNMPHYGNPLKPVKWLNNKLGLPKAAVAPTVIIKEEDRARLREWQNKAGVKIHIWHMFFDLAFGLPLDRAENLITTELINPTIQTFQAPGGATQKKIIYKIYYHYAYALGDAKEEPLLKSDYIEDKNGHILPFVRFSGGRLNISSEVIKVLDDMVRERGE